MRSTDNSIFWSGWNEHWSVITRMLIGKNEVKVTAVLRRYCIQGSVKFPIPGLDSKNAAASSCKRSNKTQKQNSHNNGNLAEPRISIWGRLDIYVFDKLWTLTWIILTKKPKRNFYLTRFVQTLDTDNILTNIGYASNFQAKAEQADLGHILDKNLSKVCPTYEILDI